MRILLTGLAILIGLYLVLLFLVYVFQRQFLYFPDQSVPSENQLNQIGIASVLIGSGPDGDVRSLWQEAGTSGSPVILFLHGNAGSHYHRIPIYQALAEDGAAVLGVGYPGYGGNAGSPTQATLFQIAQDNYDWLIEQGIPPSQIVIVGESLGSGVATHLASQNRAAGLILAAAYTGMDEMAQRQFPIFPARWLIKDRYRSIDRISDIEMPLVWIHGTNDELIPFAMGQRLFDAAGAPKEAFAIEKGGHNDLWQKGADQIVREASRKILLRAKAETAAP
ncbi:MAG: alpha/beta hydrolase [Sphingorhabdus sp.]